MEEYLDHSLIMCIVLLIVDLFDKVEGKVKSKDVLFDFIPLILTFNLMLAHETVFSGKIAMCELYLTITYTFELYLLFSY